MSQHGTITDQSVNAHDALTESARPRARRGDRKGREGIGEETFLTSSRPRARGRDAFRSGEGMGTYSEAAAQRCTEAIDRAEAVVVQAIPDARRSPHFALLVGRALSHGSMFGSVSAAELRRLLARLESEDRR